MFRTYQTLFNRLLMCLDALIVVFSFIVAWYLKFDSGLLAHGKHESLMAYKGAILFGVAIFLISNALAGLYRPMRAKSMMSEGYAVLKSVIIGMFAQMAVLYFIKLEDFSRDALAIFAVTFFVLTFVERLSIRSVLRAMRRKGLNQKFILVVGWNHAAERFVRTLEHQPWFGYRLLGFLSDNASETDLRPRSGVPSLGQIGQLGDTLAAHLVDQVIVALPRDKFDAIGHVLAQCDASGVQSLILPDYFDLLPARPRFETFGDIPLIDTRYVPLDDAMNAALKRLFDIVFSVFVMVLLSPVVLAIAVGIRLTSEGPIVFVQERVGKNRRVFKMYKFRTMEWDPNNEPDEEESPGDKRWTVRDDPRRTAFGSFLRKTSLDELPQFWNVFIGDMSVIGPRPERPHFVEQFQGTIPRYMVKHRVRPGITGWAQVHGWRGDTSIADRIQYDLEYIENWSFWMDIRIIGKTLRDGFVNQNAY